MRMVIEKTIKLKAMILIEEGDRELCFRDSQDRKCLYLDDEYSYCNLFDWVSLENDNATTTFYRCQECIDAFGFDGGKQ